MSAQPGTASPSEALPFDIVAAMAEACEAHQAGDLQRAERGYRAVLAAREDHPDALHLLGLLVHQRGQAKLAVSLVERAITVAPNKADFHFNLGKLHKLQGRPELAIPCYERAHRLAPDNPGTLLNLGNCWRARGNMSRAERCYRLALERNGDYVAALNNLGTLCRADGRLEEAVGFYQRAVTLDRDSPEVWENLAKTLTDGNHLEEAAEAYRRALKLDPKRETAGHMLAAIEGRTTESAPQSYVRSLFDDYAPRFERHLIGELDYGIPRLIRETLDAELPGSGPAFSQALDLGCGTGLVGAAVRDRVEWLQGVDLSAKMLAQARRKEIYDALEEAEIVAFLERTPPASRDLILAADVLIYVGALDRLLPEAARCLEPGGRLLLSVERHDSDPDDGGEGNDGCDKGYALRPSGRYAHSEAYLRDQAGRAGLKVTSCRETPIRKNGEEILPGLLISLGHA